MNKKAVCLALLWIMFASSFSVAFAANPPKRINHVIVGTIGEPETVDPAWAYDTASEELIFNVYNRLIFFDVDRTLGRRDAGKSSEFVPSLATQWEISADGMTYTFKMRDGVEWHDGVVSTAAEMAANAEYSMERWMIFDRSGGPAWMIIEPVSGGVSFGAELTAEYATMVDAAVEDFTNATGSYLQLNLGMSYPPFLTIIAQSWAGILRKDWVAAHNGFPGLDVTGTNPAVWGAWNDPDVSPLDDYPEGTGGKVMMGTGAYKFDYWSPGVEYSIFRHAAYFAGWPANLPGQGGAHPSYPGSGYAAGWIERVTEKFIDEWSTRKMMFLAGDLDFVYVPRGHIPELITNWQPGSFSAPDPEELPPGVRVDKDLPLLVASPWLFFSFDIDPSSSYLGPGFDAANPNAIAEDRIPVGFFSDIDVRKGFAYAIDYDKYIREFYFGEASRAITPIVEGLKYHNPDQTGYDYNLALAEEHFRAAWGGQVWEKGFTLTATYNTGNVGRQVANELIEAAIESLNPKFHITVESVPWPTYLGALVSFKLTVFVLGWLADYPDPHNFAQPFMHSEGTFSYFQRYSNPTVDALVEAGIATPDGPEREAIYYELQRLYVEDVPGVGLAKPDGRHWERTWVMGWYYNPIYPGGYYYHYWKGWLGDTDKDYDVDLDDVANVIVSMGLTIEEAIAMYGVPPGTDVDGDGFVDMDDYLLVLIDLGVVVHDVAITGIASSKTVVGQGYSMSINVTVENQGHYTETFNITAYYGNTTLTPEQREIFWSMGDVNKDGYIDDIDGNLIAAALRSTPGEPNWNPDADLNQDLKVDNRDKNIWRSNDGLDIWTYFISGAPIETQTVNNLSKGISMTLVFTWNTTDVAKGNYIISAYITPVTDETDTADNSYSDGVIKVTIAGDVDGDYSVGSRDFSILAGAYGTSVGDPLYDARADIDSNGNVGSSDFSILAGNYGKTDP